MGVRTRATAQLGDGWLWPRWLEEQLDPPPSAGVPRDHRPVLTNVANRNWTTIGNLASLPRAMVDPCGLVTPWRTGWSLDWWIGADDRWHVPSRDAGIRQHLVAGTPVIETAMRIPGGDAVQRVYAIAGQQDLVVVEIANHSPVPVAVALAVRPVNPDRLAVVERIAIHGRTVTVDGQPALLLAKRPPVVAGSTFADGDSALTVTSGRAGSSFPDRLRCKAGLAQAAFVFPLPHGTSLSVAIPLTAERRSRWRGSARSGVDGLPELPAVLPSGEDAARSWKAQTRRGMRLELPDGRLAEAVEANRHALLLFGGDDDDFWFREAAFVISALDRYGFHGEAAELLRSYPGRQRRDTDGCALWAMAEHWRLTRDEDLVQRSLPLVAKAVRSIARERRSPRRRLGRFSYGASFWGLRGLLDGATLLAAYGQERAAATAARWAARLAADLDMSLAGVARRLGTSAIPAGPPRPLDPAVIGLLIACYPLGLLGPASEGVSATADLVRSRFCIDRAVVQSTGTSHPGLGTYLTAQLALVELEAGDRRALGRLEWMVQVASPTLAWPEAVLTQGGGGCGREGHDSLASSAFLTLVRNLLVRELWPAPATLVDGVGAEPGPAALAVCSLLPDAWLGQGIEVDQAPTAYGQLSFAVRWHGERPALLWELVPRADAGPVLISAPGLDPTWSTDAPAGEVLLSPLPAGSLS